MENYRHNLSELFSTYGLISEDLYKRICDLTFLRKYGTNNIRELVFTIYSMMKITHEDHRPILIRYIHYSSSKRVYDQIKNIKEIEEIIKKLVKMDTTYNNAHTDIEYKYLFTELS